MVEQLVTAILDTFGRVIGIWILLMVAAGFVIGLAPDDGVFPIEFFSTLTTIIIFGIVILFLSRDQRKINRPAAVAAGWIAESGAGEAIPRWASASTGLAALTTLLIRSQPVGFSIIVALVATALTGLIVFFYNRYLENHPPVQPRGNRPASAVRRRAASRRTEASERK